jgi:hypothetical protein
MMEDDEASELDAPAMMARIDELERRAMRLKAPTSYDGSLYTARLHIGLIRSHLDAILANGAARHADGERSSAGLPASRLPPPPPDRRSGNV